MSLLLLTLLTCCGLLHPVFTKVTGTKECAKMMTDVDKCIMQLMLMNEEGRFNFPIDGKHADAYCE